MAGKRVSLASLATAKVEAVPGAGRPDLVHVHPDTVAPTPLNPRRNFDETELAELGEDMRSGQLQPCVAVSKAAYLKLYPEHAGQLSDKVRYVMAAGERRWRAAVKVGLDSLDVLLRHDLTESRIRFLAAVLSENVQRANFNPIEEANGLRAMLDLHDGNQSAAAQAMGKSKQWFNQRIGLLRLTDQMMQLVLEGKLTAFRDMRRYAAMPPQEQYRAWKSDQEQPRTPKESERATYTAVYAGAPPAEASAGPAPHDGSGPASFTAVKPVPAPVPGHAEPAPVGNSPEPPHPPAVSPPAADPKVPEARPAEREQQTASGGPGGPGGTPSRTLPYDDGTFVAHHLIRKMPDEALELAIRVLNQHAAEHGLNVLPQHTP